MRLFLLMVLFDSPILFKKLIFKVLVLSQNAKNQDLFS